MYLIFDFDCILKLMVIDPLLNFVTKLLSKDSLLTSHDCGITNFINKMEWEDKCQFWINCFNDIKNQPIEVLSEDHRGQIMLQGLPRVHLSTTKV